MVTHAYPRWDGDVAGVFIERLAIALVRRGHRVTVIAPADAGAGGRGRRGGVDVVRVRYAPARGETLAYRGTMEQAARSLSGKLVLASLVNAQARVVAQLSRFAGGQIVHAHWWVPGGVGAWLARFTGGSRYVVTLHGTDVAVLERSRSARFMARRILKRASAVTAVSGFLAARAAEAIGIESRQVVVQAMPVDTQRFTRTSVGGGGVVTVGRLVPQKRIDLIIDAVALLRQKGRPFRLTIIGDGPERAALERRAEEAGIGTLTRFHGQVEPNRLADTIGDADVFAFAASQEGLGLTAAEALMLGIPVVACVDGGGVTDIVPTTGAGRLVPPARPERMARAIAELARDSSVRAAAADAGRLLRRRLDPDYVAQTYEEVYARASRKGRRR